jgi:ATP-dependent Clp protease ATP-binding subunit ClpX
LVEGPGEVYICAECVELCQSIIVQEKRRRLRSQNPPLPLLTPESLQARLPSFVRMPESDLKALAVAVHSHYHGGEDAHRKKDGQNLLLLVGSSWSSAMLLTRALAYILDVPFSSGRAEQLARLESNESIVFRLLNASDFDAEAAQRGIVLLDGMDSRNAQEMLVNDLEGKVEKALPSGLQIEVACILFVCLGPFIGLNEQLIRQGRHPEQPIASDDLLAFGVLPDFVRRLRAVIRLSPPDEETVMRLTASADLQRFAKGSGVG